MIEPKIKLKRGFIKKNQYIKQYYDEVAALHSAKLRDIKIRNLIKSLFISGLSAAKKTHLKNSVETKIPSSSID